MSHTKNWMVDDNLGKMNASRDRRALRRAIETCCITAAVMEGQRRVVGAGLVRIKEQLSPEEMTALQHATSFDLDQPTLTSLSHANHR